MKRKLLYLLSLPLLALSFAACGDDDDDVVAPTNVPEVCSQAFASRYPDVKNPKWEREGQYYTAEWTKATPHVEYEAWFKNSAQAAQSWAMTETDYGKDFFLVPAELNAAFNKTDYAYATVDDIDYYEYPDPARNAYIIEVSPAGAADVLLVFRATDYTLVKTMPDTDISITPDTVIF